LEKDEGLEEIICDFSLLLLLIDGA